MIHEVNSAKLDLPLITTLPLSLSADSVALVIIQFAWG